jgi:hypothetical protein
MNERILKLVTEARHYAWDNETHWSAGPERERLFEEKFAKLIIKDCIDVGLEQKKLVEDTKVFDHRDIVWTNAKIQQSQHIVNEIEKHFGVEE